MPAQYNVAWKADGQASGIYFVRMNAADTDQIQKVILIPFVNGSTVAQRMPQIASGRWTPLMAQKASFAAINMRLPSRLLKMAM